MKKHLIAISLFGITLLGAGCAASGPKYTEVAQSFPTLAPEEGRIYFFRSNSMFGAAVQPDIHLDGPVVGKSQPGGFFFVDRPAGRHLASATTETEKTLTFTLDAGETKYVRTSPSIGVLVGRIVLELEDPKKAHAEIEKLAFTGKLPLPKKEEKTQTQPSK